MNAFRKLFSSAGDFRVEDPRSGPWNRRDFYKVKSGSNYDIKVEIQGEPPYSSCVLSVNAVTGNERKLPIAARFSWKKYYRGPEEDINITSNTLHLSALDSGYYIKVYVNPIEEDNIYREVSSIIFGPVVLDPLIKKTIQGIMRAGGFKFQLKRISLSENDEVGTDAFIMLNKTNTMIVSKSNQNNRICINMNDKFKIISQRNQFMTMTFDFLDSSKSNQIAQFFVVPKTKNFRKVKLTLSSINSKDILILSMNIFKGLLKVRDGDLFDLVRTFMKDAPMITGTSKPSDPELDSEDEENSEPAVHQNRDAIDLLLMNNGLKDESLRVYNSNKQMELEKNSLQARLFDLESKTGFSKSSSMNENDFQGGHHDESSIMDQNKIQMIKQKNKDIEKNIESIQAQNEQVRKEVERISNIFKQMRYKEMIESKINASISKPDKDISNFEQALDVYTKEYKRVMEKFSESGKDNKGGYNLILSSDSDRSLSLIDEMEEKIQEVNMKNERLKEEIIKHKGLLRGVEENEITKQGASFMINNDDNSFMKKRGGLRSDLKSEYEMRIESLESRINRISTENAGLNEQLEELTEKLKEEEENDQEALKYRRLKVQQNELKLILEKKKNTIKELENKKIALNDQEVDLRTSTERQSNTSVKSIEDALFKKDQLMRINQNLFRELQEQKTKQFELEENQKSLYIESNTSHQSLLPPSSTTKNNIEKLKASIKEVEERLAAYKNDVSIQNNNNRAKLSKEDVTALEDAKKMNEKLINEIVRLNEMVKKSEKDRDVSIFK